MSRRAVIATAVAAGIVVIVALAMWQAPRVMTHREARKAISDYDAALSRAVGSLNPEVMRPVTSEREFTRVSMYVTKLWGEGRYLESTLLELRIRDVFQQGDGFIASADETWRFQEREREGRAPLGAVTERVEHVRYTLVRDESGKLVVELAEYEEAGGRPE